MSESILNALEASGGKAHISQLANMTMMPQPTVRNYLDMLKKDNKVIYHSSAWHLKVLASKPVIKHQHISEKILECLNDKRTVADLQCMLADVKQIHLQETLDSLEKAGKIKSMKCYKAVHSLANKPTNPVHPISKPINKRQDSNKPAQADPHFTCQDIRYKDQQAPTKDQQNNGAGARNSNQYSQQYSQSRETLSQFQQQFSQNQQQFNNYQHRPSQNQNHASQNQHRPSQNKHHPSQNQHHASQNQHHASQNQHHPSQNQHHPSQNQHHPSQNQHHASQNQHHPSQNQNHASQNQHHSSQNQHHASQNQHHNSQNQHHSSRPQYNNNQQFREGPQHFREGPQFNQAPRYPGPPAPRQPGPMPPFNNAPFTPFNGNPNQAIRMPCDDNDRPRPMRPAKMGGIDPYTNKAYGCSVTGYQNTGPSKLVYKTPLRQPAPSIRQPSSSIRQPVQLLNRPDNGRSQKKSSGGRGKIGRGKNNDPTMDVVYDADRRALTCIKREPGEEEVKAQMRKDSENSSDSLGRWNEDQEPTKVLLEKPKVVNTHVEIAEDQDDAVEMVGGMLYSEDTSPVITTTFPDSCDSPPRLQIPPQRIADAFVAAATTQPSLQLNLAAVAVSERVYNSKIKIMQNQQNHAAPIEKLSSPPAPSSDPPPTTPPNQYKSPPPHPISPPDQFYTPRSGVATSPKPHLPTPPQSLPTVNQASPPTLDTPSPPTPTQDPTATQAPSFNLELQNISKLSTFNFEDSDSSDSDEELISLSDMLQYKPEVRSAPPAAPKVKLGHLLCPVSTICRNEGYPAPALVTQHRPADVVSPWYAEVTVDDRFSGTGEGGEQRQAVQLAVGCIKDAMTTKRVCRQYRQQTDPLALMLHLMCSKRGFFNPIYTLVIQHGGKVKIRAVLHGDLLYENKAAGSVDQALSQCFEECCKVLFVPVPGLPAWEQEHIDYKQALLVQHPQAEVWSHKVGGDWMGEVTVNGVSYKAMKPFPKKWLSEQSAACDACYRLRVDVFNWSCPFVHVGRNTTFSKSKR